MNSVTAAIKPEWLLKPARSNHIHAARMGLPGSRLLGRNHRLARRAFFGSNEVRCGMRSFYSMLALSLCSVFCHAQTAVNDVPDLKQLRAKYDAPFERNLQSFTCAVQFNWKQHFTEVVRLGDEGTDEEIAQYIQPISTRVTVTRQNTAVSSGMTEDEERKLPHGGMAEGLLKHAVQYSLNNWLAASGTSLLPLPGTSAHIEPSASGYKLGLRPLMSRCYSRAISVFKVKG